MSIKKNVNFLLYFSTIHLLLISCASSPVNDFFGIKMYPLDEQNFQIVDYSAEKGISYKSSPKMNPNLFAWAEIEINTIKVIVQNNTKEKIPLNYNVDEFVLVTNEKSFYLEKGNRIKYTDRSEIKPNSSFEISLELPADYWKTLGGQNNYVDETQLTKDILKGYSKSGTKFNVGKENIKYILIKFGHSATLVLKAVATKS